MYQRPKSALADCETSPVEKDWATEMTGSAVCVRLFMYEIIQ